MRPWFWGVVVVSLSLLAPGTAFAATPLQVDEPAVQLTTSAIDREPCITIDRLGKTHIVFRRDGHDPGLWYSTDRSGSWRTTRLLTGGNLICETLGANARGRIHVLLACPGPPCAGEVGHLTNQSGRWRQTTVATNARASSLALDALGRPAVAILDAAGIRYLVQREGIWRARRILRSTALGVVSPLRLTATGWAHIAYSTQSAVHRLTNRTGAWRSTTVARRVSATQLELALDRLGRGAIGILTHDGIDRLQIRVERSGRWPLILDRRGSITHDLESDRLGNLHLLVTYQGFTQSLRYSTFRSGAWRNRTLDPLGEPLARAAALAVDAAGRATVLTGRGGYLSWYSNRSGGWRSRPQTTSTSGRPGDVAIGPDARPTLAISRSGQAPGIVLLADTPAGWITSYVTHDGTDHVPSILVDAAGHRHVAWIRGEGRYAEVWYATDETGSWAATKVGSAPTQPAVDIVLDANGRPSVVFSSFGRELQASQGPGGWTLTQLFMLPHGGGTAAISTLPGVLHVACHGSQSAPYVLAYATNVSGGWTTLTVADPAAFGESDFVPSSLAVAGGLVVIGVTAMSPAGGKSAWIASSTGGGPWVIERLATDAADPQVAIEDGVIHAVLTAGDGTIHHMIRTGTTWTDGVLPVPAPARSVRVAQGGGLLSIAAEVSPEGYGISSPLRTPSTDAGIWFLRR